jgi:hypothetical protein
MKEAEPEKKREMKEETYSMQDVNDAAGLLVGVMKYHKMSMGLGILAMDHIFKGLKQKGVNFDVVMKPGDKPQ